MAVGAEQPLIAGALAGVKVLDLTQMLAGPFATMILADHGARVIKIEPPGGDRTRLFGPFLEVQTRVPEGGYGGYFGSTNRNKESIVIDLKAPAGRAAFLRLVASADVLVENFRAGVMERLDIGFETLLALNPRLVYATIRGFGDPRTGVSPYADWPAYDVVAQAMGGIIAVTSPTPGGPPTKIGPGVGDIIPAMQCTIGILAALHHARATGQGQMVDVAMLDGVLAACERIVFQYAYDGRVPGPEGNSHPLLCPYGIFPALDGWVAIGCPHDEFWRLLVRTIGRPELADDPRYRTTPQRLDRRTEVEGVVTAWTSARSKAEITAVLGAKIPFGPVRGIDEIAADPHTAARAMLASVEIPGAGGRLGQVANTAIKLTATPGGVRSRAPLTGEHTRSVFTDHGFTAEEIADLAAAGAIDCRS